MCVNFIVLNRILTTKIHILFPEVACVENVCKGYNSWRNLLLTKTTLLSPLMKYPPNAIQGDVDRFLNDVEELKMSQSDVLHWFQKQLTKSKVYMFFITCCI